MTDEMRIHTPNGEILARDNFVIAFFGRRPFAEMAAGARAAVEQWLKIVPSDCLKWALVGKSSTKYQKLTPQVVKRCFAMLDKDVTTKTDVYFKILGPQTAGPDYMALIKGYKKPAKIGFGDETNLVEFLFPSDFPSLFGEDRVVDLAASMFEALPCDSGYASPALYYGMRGVYEEAARFIAPLALQHHGYDVPNNAGTAAKMGGSCRGARWLTMLSNEMVDQVGGAKRLKQQVARGVESREVPRGVVIRAGAKPEIGSVNRGQNTPLLASVAHAVERITYFGDNSILPLFGRQIDVRDRWERRFWWDEE
jgi:Protein of unknown function (DUF3396)